VAGDSRTVTGAKGNAVLLGNRARYLRPGRRGTTRSSRRIRFRRDQEDLAEQAIAEMPAPQRCCAASRAEN